MKRMVSLCVVALFVAMAIAVPASAGVVPNGSSAFGASSVTWEQRYMQWLFGSDTNPLMQQGLCGDTFNGVLFLNVATVPDFDADCTVKPGTQILASPGGTIEWSPTNGVTDEQLLADSQSTSAAVADPSGSLDGRPINIGTSLTAAGAFTISVGDNSFIKAVDPTFPSDLSETRVVPPRRGCCDCPAHSWSAHAGASGHDQR